MHKSDVQYMQQSEKDENTSSLAQGTSWMNACIKHVRYMQAFIDLAL